MRSTPARRCALIMGFGLILASCQQREASPPSDTPAEGTTEATTAVREAADSIVAAFGRQDSAAYFSRFAPEASFIFHTNAKRLDDRGAYEAEWHSWGPAGFRVRTCSSSDQRVQRFGDIAVFTHSVRTEVTTPGGDATQLERETIVFQQRDGHWIAIHEHLSPLPR